MHYGYPAVHNGYHVVHNGYPAVHNGYPKQQRILIPREDFVKLVLFHLSDRSVIVFCENKPEPQTPDGLVDFGELVVLEEFGCWVGLK